MTRENEAFNYVIGTGKEIGLDDAIETVQEWLTDCDYSQETKEVLSTIITQLTRKRLNVETEMILKERSVKGMKIVEAEDNKHD